MHHDMSAQKPGDARDHRNESMPSLPIADLTVVHPKRADPCLPGAKRQLLTARTGIDAAFTETSAAQPSAAQASTNGRGDFAK